MPPVRHPTAQGLKPGGFAGLRSANTAVLHGRHKSQKICYRMPMYARRSGLLLLCLGACSGADPGADSKANPGASDATTSGGVASSGAPSANAGMQSNGGTPSSGAASGVVSAGAMSAGASSGGAAAVGAAGTSPGGATSSAGGAANAGGSANPSQGGNPMVTAGMGQGGSTPAAGASLGGAGTAGVDNMGGAGTDSGPSFDRTAVCTGGPYPAHPLEATDVLTAGSISGTETDGALGFHIFEGPVWFGGSLYFSHLIDKTGMNDPMAAGERYTASIQRLTAASTVEDVLVGADSNGLAIDPNGNLIGATQGNQSISRFDLTNMAVASLITSVNGTPVAQAPAFNSPNDLTVRSDGVIYFTDPNWQNDGRPSIGDRKLYVVTPDGAATAVDTPFYSESDDPDGGPNGVILSLDEQTLYVSGNGGTRIATYPVNPDGSLGAPGEFPADADYVPEGDGMTLDCAGNLYMAGDSIVFVYSSTGEELGQIQPGDGEATNVAFGGEDATTLYITVLGQGIPQLSSIDIGIPGLPY